MPLGFIVALASLAFVMQTLGNSSSSVPTASGSELLKQFEIVEITPPAAIPTDKDDNEINLASLFIKPTLVTFWRVNCGECDTGLPLLDNFGKSQSSVALILIAVKDDPKNAQEKLQSLNVALPTYYDRDGTAFQNWEATMPASYFVINGKLKYFFPGRVSNEHLQALLTVR